jgi:hypothetical protein
MCSRGGFAAIPRVLILIKERSRRVAILTNVTHSDRLLGFDMFLKQRPERAPPLEQLVKASAEGRAENHHAHRQEGYEDPSARTGRRPSAPQARRRPSICEAEVGVWRGSEQKLAVRSPIRDVLPGVGPLSARAMCRLSTPSLRRTRSGSCMF